MKKEASLKQCQMLTKRGRQCKNKGWFYPQSSLVMCDLHVADYLHKKYSSGGVHE